MDIRIITEKLQFDIYGFGSVVTNKNYAGTAFKLSGKMWKILKVNDVKNKGKNIWVYDTADKVFAGVEIDNPADNTFELEKITIDIEKYAYYKHIGAYNHIKQTGQQMTDRLVKQGHEIILPYIEIYGHWNKDESKLETELIMCIK